jgi:hypothetical protein
MRAPAFHLSVAFGVASAVAHAQGTNDPVNQLRACSAMEHAERLECLDKLSREVAPPPRQAPQADSRAENWIVSETTSPVDYTPIIAATAASRRGADGASMQLSIHCRRGRTELVVTGPAVTLRGEDYSISYRINDEQPVQLAAATPSFGAGAAFKGDVVRLLQSLPDEGGISIRLFTRAGVVVDGYFQLSGLRMVRDRVSTACRWPHAISRQPN